ncbi:MAG TPA: bifunctional YncE family protein/alkaline phosphatase family protein [Solirubrobacterales bacterium]|nr:bifunctional YncE family protein/alkaline phosphatase family protein [Solirubrobacterales bacterium]
MDIARRAFSSRIARGLRNRVARGYGSRALAAALVLLAVTAAAASAGFGPFGTDQVGQQVGDRVLLPSNQWVSPVGNRIPIQDGRLVSSTLSPDGTKLAALTWRDFTGFLTIIDVKTGKVVQQIGTGKSGDPALGDGTVGPDGPYYSPDGKTLWLPQSADLMRFTVDPDGTVSSPVTIKLKGPHGDALPAGMALSADGSKLYVALNGSNTLGVIDTATNQLVKEIPVGNAPRQVAIDGNEAFVSNEGGRPTTGSDFTNSSDGTPIVANPSTGGSITGTVSVVDLGSETQTDSIPVGLEPTALYLHGGALFVANSNDDSVSIVDTSSKRVTQTFDVNPVPGASVGSYPNAITMPDPNHVLISIGRDNAIADYSYSGPGSPLHLEGLLPTDWYPVQVQFDSALGGQIVVTNDKGIGARGPDSTINKGPQTNPATGHNTYDDTGTVTTFALPEESQLPQYTHTVFADNAWDSPGRLASAAAGADSAVPNRLGGGSPIKHVFVVVKENRTYDQVLGDLPDGNGDPSLAQFGHAITPNQHALAEQFGTFDNFYDEGTLSADGHNWIVQADANDYVEKEFGAFYRSYPAEGGDALAYQRDGFLWNAAQRAGDSVADFGEYAFFFNVPSSGAPSWADWYRDSQILEGKESGPLPVPIDKYQTYSDIPSLNAIIDRAYPRFNLDVPDQYRVDIWERAFHKAEQTGNLANLNLLWLPDDHTSGLNSGDPYPVAQVADNDLALGRIVQDISHSRFWKSSAIFVLEDDPQNGVDHVDGHRSVLWAISPYSRRGAVNDRYYSQINVVRTVEQILGIQPMNQEDGTAEPMYDAFTNRPDFQPYGALPNQVPLTLGVPSLSPAAASSSRVRHLVHVPASERAVYRQWVAWSAHQRFTGRRAEEDAANPEQLNRLDWYSATGWRRPYPGELRILAPGQVPGRHRPSIDIGDG